MELIGRESNIILFIMIKRNEKRNKIRKRGKEGIIWRKQEYVEVRRGEKRKKT